MFRKWVMLGVVWIAVSILFWAQTIPVRAQEPQPTAESDANCVSCHIHEYYVYDSGKWYCLCEAPMHCVYCHSGRTDSYVKEVAHEGLVLYPTRDHAVRCQNCHVEDYMSRVVTFETVAGISQTPLPLVTATAVEPVALAEAPSSLLQLFLSRLDLWQVIGLGILAFGLIVIFIFGYRCWRADCLAKIRNKG